MSDHYQLRMSDKFALHWNDFQSNAVKNYSKLRNNSEFMDVTLVGDDHKLISAHKIILTSCSEYFRSILSKHKHSNPLICLDGVSSQDIENALDFIYKGVLHVFHEDLDRFLEIAQKLKLEGLKKKQDKYDSPILKTEELLIEKEKLYENTIEPLLSTTDLRENVISFNSNETPNGEELDSKLRENLQKTDGCTKCMICGQFFTNSTSCS